jgi:cytochrome c-type biogenesis protein CcmH/NrfG
VSRPHPDGPRLVGAVAHIERQRGLQAFEQADYGQAIQAWKQALRSGAPSDLVGALAEAHFRRALGTTNAGRRAQDLHEAVQLRPDRALYHFHLGLACFRLGQLRRAVAALETAHRLDPREARFERHLALARLSEPAARLDGFELPDGALAGEEIASRLHALVALRQNEPARAAASLVTLTKPSSHAGQSPPGPMRRQKHRQSAQY